MSQTKISRIAGAVMVASLICACGGGKKVPSVTGLSFEEAEKALKDAGLTAKAEEPHDGKVKSQDPASGEAAPKDGVVTLVLEKEASADGVPVPDLTGKTVAEAKAILEGAGFTLGAVTTRIAEKPVNVVVDQSPKPNNPIAAGQAVAVVAADESQVLVPALIGKTEEQAREALKGLLEIEKVEETCRPGAEPVEAVYESIPRGGDSTSRTSKVVLRIKDDCVAVPRVIDLDKGLAFTRLNGVGLLGNPTGSVFDPPKKDRVQNQKPLPDTLLAKGSQVNLVFYSDRRLFDVGIFADAIKIQRANPTLMKKSRTLGRPK
jgi:hypothetical protein